MDDMQIRGIGLKRYVKGSPLRQIIHQLPSVRRYFWRVDRERAMTDTSEAGSVRICSRAKKRWTWLIMTAMTSASINVYSYTKLARENSSQSILKPRLQVGRYDELVVHWRYSYGGPQLTTFAQTTPTPHFMKKSCGVGVVCAKVVSCGLPYIPADVIPRDAIPTPLFGKYQVL